MNYTSHVQLTNRSIMVCITTTMDLITAVVGNVYKQENTWSYLQKAVSLMGLLYFV